MSGNKKRQRILKLSMLGLEALLLSAVIIVSVSVINNINSVRNNINNKIITENQANDNSNETNESHSNGDNGEESDNNAAVLSVNAAVVSAGADTNDLNRHYIFVGDSRYVGMKKYSQSNDTFIAKNGEGYAFLIENLTLIQNSVDKDSVLIIGLGVNDYARNYKNYIQIVNELAISLQCPVYYMLINPVDEEKEMQYGYTVFNEQIDKYNKLMQEGFDSSVRIIDTNSYLKSSGFNTVDGLHYDDSTYKKIYDYIKSNVL